MDPNKAGFKTSEFWVAIAGIGAIVWKFAQDNCTVDSGKLIALVILIGGYIAGRSWIKARALAEKK